MALLAAAKLTDEMLRLVRRHGYTAAIDLKLRYAEVHSWFAGIPVYVQSIDATYPPATYVTLWPLLGWLPLEPARWLWALTTVIALAVMVWFIVRESGASDAWERACAALLLLAMNQTGVVVGNGQLLLHVLPPLVIGLALIERGHGSWTDDALAAACLVFAMVKVTLAAPFLWLVLFAPRTMGQDRRWPFRLRPALLVATSYALLTVFAASFQDARLWQQLREWVRIGGRVAERRGDYANVSAWLIDAGFGRLALPAAIVLFVALGIWLYRYRAADLWVRLGVTAIITRLWTYHRQYDDVMVVLALVALFRIVTSASEDAPDSRRVRAAAAALIAVTMFFALLPARLGTGPSPWREIYAVSHTTTWLGMLTYLCAYAARARGRLAS